MSEELIIAKRNIIALNEGLKRLNVELQDSKQLTMQLQQQITIQAQQLTNLTQQVAIIRASTLGRGPTG